MLRFKVLELPLELYKQRDFPKKIEKINTSVFNHLQYLKSIIEKQHKSCLVCFKETRKIIAHYQKILQKRQFSQLSSSGSLPAKQSPMLLYFQELIRGISQINQVMEGQLSKNSIFMQNRKNGGLKKCKNLINEKLIKVNILVSDYLKSVKVYNEMGRQYIKRTEYFQEIDNDPIKYYSLKKNQKNYNKAINMEESLTNKLEQIQNSKNQIKVAMIEISIKIREFYESIRVSTEELRRIQDSIKYLVNSPKFNGEIQEIKQVREEQQYTQGSQYNQFNSLSKGENNSDNQIPRFDAKKNRKQKAIYLQFITYLERTFEEFVQSYIKSISEVFNQLNEYQKSKEYRKFTQQKLIMSEILAPRSIQDIDLIIIQFNELQNSLHRIALTLHEKLFEQFFKYKRHIIKRYIEELDGVIEKQRKIGGSLNGKEYQDIDVKFHEAERDIDNQIKDKVDETIIRIHQAFSSSINTEMPKVTKKTDLFSKAYFEILTIPYFSHNQKLPAFERSDLIRQYEKILDEQKLYTAVFQLEKEFQSPDENQGKKRATSCCGLIHKKHTSSKKQNNNKMDSFSCAIKNGYLFLHGTLSVYETHLRFKSHFNPDTFFGSMDLCIAKSQIRQIIEGTHLMSLLISIVTKVGTLQFTNFLANPLKVFGSVYLSNKICRSNDNQEKQLNILKIKFEQQFSELAELQKLKILKQNSDMIEDTLVLSYAYQLITPNQKSKTSNVFTFKIKITKQYEKKLEYFFWHCANQNDINIKKMIESICKRLISENCHRRVKSLIKKEQEINNDISKFDFQMEEEKLESNHNQPNNFLNETIQNISTIEKRHSTIIQQAANEVVVPNFKEAENKVSKKSTNDHIKNSHRERKSSSDDKQKDQSYRFSQASTIKYPPNRYEKQSIRTRKPITKSEEQKQNEKSLKLLKVLVIIAIIMTFLNIFL